MTEPDFDNSLNHWPHAANRLRDNLDLDRLESHAIGILARAMRTERLVAFVGAGASVAYGRLAWGALMEKLYDEIKGTKAAKESPIWENVIKHLWQEKVDYLRCADHAIKAQILDMALKSSGKTEDRIVLRVTEELKDYKGFLLGLAKKLGINETAINAALANQAAVTQQDLGLRAILQLILRGKKPTADTLNGALARHSVQADSPLATLIREWGIRRFVTTNYDHEIERALMAQGFEPSTSPSPSPHSPRYRCVTFGRTQTAKTFQFAYEGPRRNAQILHLHGDVIEPETVVITESQYQQLYLHDHPTRDLVNNAALGVFAANPLLFVGSDASEDDLLRPMRQIMTGDGHRSDRMAVALLATRKDHKDRALQATRLLLRHGVHTVYFGFDTTTSNPSDEPWLHRLIDLVDDYQAKKFAAVGGKKDWPGRLAHLDCPKSLDGFPINQIPELNFSDQLTELKALCKPATYKTPLFGAKLEVFRDWATSAFLCAKLLSMRHAVNQRIDFDVHLPRVYHRPPELGSPSAGLNVQVRHGVQQRHDYLTSRFEKGAYDEGIGALCADIQKNAGFRSSRGRRIIAVCGPRGSGKGAQASRLVPAAVNPTGNYPELRLLLAAMAGYPTQQDMVTPCHVLSLNLSFSNEVGPIISQFAAVLDRAVPPASGMEAPSDQLEQLQRGLVRLKKPTAPRVLLILGNAGVLFDAEGKAKNGQVKRVLRMVMSSDFATIPLDILMYIGEAQMPAELRWRGPLTSPASTGTAEAETDGRPARRLRRYNIGIRDSSDSQYLVHEIKRVRLTELARAYFPSLTQQLGWQTDPARGSPEHDFIVRLFMAAGGSRYAMTLALALVDTESDSGPDAKKRLLDEILIALSGATSGSAVERMIEFSLDRWHSRHVRGQTLKKARPEFKMSPPPPLPLPFHCRSFEAALDTLTDQPILAYWKLATELLWHLSAFGQPIEVNVLANCPAVVDALNLAGIGPNAHLNYVAASLELLVHWCLVFRVNPRPLPSEVEQRATNPTRPMDLRYRYTLHRHLQRHMVRLMGGRNLEATQWDPFSLTLYASMPDEAPVLKPEAHLRLMQLLQHLTAYPTPASGLSSGQQQAKNTKELVNHADNIRAAYYLVRSTYSLGLISHLVPEAQEEGAVCGHMEEYARIIRWITQSAVLWERGPESKNWQAGDGRQMGLFYPGELVWLYHECGVIHLAQGRLNDAEELLTLAEQAARRVEADNTGSMHARIRLHTGLVQLERGRPQRAKHILYPLAQRQNGHPVLPLLASFYLGLIEHIGGNYTAADRYYSKALRPLEKLHRSRAAAFVLISRANLACRLRPDRPLEALAMANEAISLAHQGGHEDLRHLALIQRVRICADTGLSTEAGQPGHFEVLSAAQRYAVRMQIPRIACEVHQARASLLLRQGEYEMSVRDAAASLEIAALYDLKLFKARGLLILAKIYHRRRDVDGARELVKMGSEIANACDYFTCVRGFKELDLLLDSE